MTKKEVLRELHLSKAMNYKNENILGEFWEYIEKKETKTAKRVLDWLSKDRLYSIIADYDRYWFETVCWADVPEFVIQSVDRWAKKKGLTYLYE